MSRETIPMSEDEAIAIVRNPWGHREDDVRRARLRVCARMEAWRDAYHNMRQFAIDEGPVSYTHLTLPTTPYV